MPEGPPRLSVIIPAYNEEKYLGATLRSLKESAARYEMKSGRRVEFIVVDNSSTDSTAEVARTEGARVVSEPVRQIAAARNRGAEAARGEILVTCDADNQASANLLERVDEVMSSGQFIGGGVRIRPEPGPWGAMAMFSVFNFLADAASLSFGVLYTDRNTFRAIGGFPTSVYVGEDALFVINLKRQGRRQGKKFSNLKDAYIVTSLRKIRQFGVLPQLLTYLKFAFFPWTARRRESCPTWYDVRGQ